MGIMPRIAVLHFLRDWIWGEVKFTKLQKHVKCILSVSEESKINILLGNHEYCTLSFKQERDQPA